MSSKTTNPTIAYKNKLKRTIKTAMNALNMDEATYRDMLERVTMRVSGKAKNSIKNMTIDELNAVMNEMRNKGFTAVRGKYGKGQDGTDKNGKMKENSVRNGDNPLDRPMMGKVRALWITMYQQGIIKDGSDNALNAFVRRTVNTHRKKEGKKTLIINLFGTSDRELWGLIETLKSWQQRELDKRKKKT